MRNDSKILVFLYESSLICYPIKSLSEDISSRVLFPHHVPREKAVDQPHVLCPAHSSIGLFFSSARQYSRHRYERQRRETSDVRQQHGHAQKHRVVPVPALKADLFGVGAAVLATQMRHANSAKTSEQSPAQIR